MAETYKQFDKDPIVSESDVVIKGFKFRKRELALGGLCIVCLLVIIILAALLASSKSSSGGGSNDGASAGAQTGGAGGDGVCLDAACLKAGAHVLGLINNSVKPCDDFYSFACGQYPSLHPLPPDESETTTFLDIYYQNQDRLRKLLEKPPIDNNVYSYDRKLKDFFFSCEDHFYKMQQRGKPLVDKVLKKLPGGWWGLQPSGQWDATSWDLNNALKAVHVDFWTDAFFTFSLITDQLDWRKSAIQIDLSGIGLPLEYYTIPESEKARSDYKNFIRTVGSLLLRDAELNLTDAETQRRVEQFVDDAFEVEKQIAELKNNAMSTQDPHSLDQRMTLRQMNTQMNGVVDWVGFFKYMFDKAPVNDDTLVVVLEKEYLVKFTEWIQTEMPKGPADFKRKLNNYMVWRLCHRYVQDLSWEYIHANRQVYVDLTGVAEFLGTWRYCMNKLDRDMYEALGALFVRDHFVDENKKKAHEITDYIRTALVESLNSKLHWMSAKTRQTAVSKVESSIMKLGYPDYMMNNRTLNQIYATLEINRTDYFANLLSFNKFFKDEWNSHLAHPGDTSVWAYATYSFVAQYYNPWKELIVPAGLLQFPIYDYRSPHYMNFGSMGSIVGRQLVHAVDEVANYYRLDGSQYGTWWSNQTIEEYKKVKECIMAAWKDVVQGPFEVYGESYPVKVAVEYYSPLALGESSGVKLALQGYRDWTKKTGGEKSMPGTSWTNEQAFFVAYAQTFCYNRTPFEAFSQAISRPYSVQENVQVNQALAQLKEFQDAFKCSDQSKMVAPKRCQLY